MTSVYDLAIVGGGINGAALLREASARGASAVLLERADFGAGSTSRSSRLVHCGLRYLATGKSLMDLLGHPARMMRALHTVRRSMQARDTLVLERPHLMKPIRMTFPIFEGDLYHGWQVDAAFALLKHFAQGRVPLDYRRYAPDRLGEELPFADYLPKNRRLRWIIAYTEYQVDWPERLTMDLIMEAEAAGAKAYNYNPVIAMEASEGVWKLHTPDGPVSAHRVANLAGPWLDEVSGLTQANAPRMVGTTRGAHVMLHLPEHFRGHGLMTLSGLDHPFYCFPWRDHHFIGPTEEPCDENPDTVHPRADERESLLAELDRQLPGLADQTTDISGGWAGLRPLTYDPGIHQAVRNRVIHRLPGTGHPAMLALSNGSIGAHAVTAGDMADALELNTADRAPPHLPITGPERYEVKAALSQHVRHLDDLVWRRLGLAWDPDAGQSHLEELALCLGRHHHWDPARVSEEMRNYLRTIRALGLVLES